MKCKPGTVKQQRVLSPLSLNRCCQCICELGWKRSSVRLWKLIGLVTQPVDSSGNGYIAVGKIKWDVNEDSRVRYNLYFLYSKPTG